MSISTKFEQEHSPRAFKRIQQWLQGICSGVSPFQLVLGWSWWTLVFKGFSCKIMAGGFSSALDDWHERWACCRLVGEYWPVLEVRVQYLDVDSDTNNQVFIPTLQHLKEVFFIYCLILRLSTVVLTLLLGKWILQVGWRPSVQLIYQEPSNLNSVHSLYSDILLVSYILTFRLCSFSPLLISFHCHFWQWTRFSSTVHLTYQFPLTLQLNSLMSSLTVAIGLYIWTPL